jgi:hypothetical protein
MIAMVAALALLVTNRFRWFLLAHTTATEFRNLTVSDGAVWYVWALVLASPESMGWSSVALGRMDPNDSNFDLLQWRPRLRSKPKHFVVIIPLWMIALPSAAVATWTILRLRRRAGHCVCGYTLAGLPVQAPCPECGSTRPLAR